MSIRHALKKSKRRRSHPAKKKIEGIDAPPEKVAQALVQAAEKKAKERRKEMA